jgi:riboflavin synthase
MFTGIIEEVGKVLNITDKKIIISAQTVLNGTKIGDSIAVNGVCLTVTKVNTNSFDADISPETMKVTVFGNLKTGSAVNLERAMSADGRFGGHIVSGHIDGLGKVKSILKENDFYRISIELPAELAKYTVKKGSISINGISLTIADIKANIISVSVIPHTFKNTNLQNLRIGDFVNIETDILGKYVEKFLSTSDNRTGISMEFLMENGF